MATQLVGPNVELFAVQAGSAANDPELAWGRKRLEVRRLAVDDERLGPEVEKLVSLDGDVWKAVSDAAQHHRVDLIAIASRQQSWVRRIFKGSAACDVVEHSSVPVLAVPDALLRGDVDRGTG